MRILAAIPHYFQPGTGKHGSSSKSPKPRIAALARQIAALHQLYGAHRCMIRIADRVTVPAGEAACGSVDILVCTAGDAHILDKLPLPEGLYERVDMDCDPLQLGHACRDELAKRIGDYDFYCYLEDDLILQDPMFFRKLTWFNKNAGNIATLLPHRFEASLTAPFHKTYIDGDLRPDVSAPFQNVQEQPQLRAQYLDTSLTFQRALNPHSGCWFLTAAQMEHFAAQEHFAERSDTFVGPLESAASLALMRTFRVYKPAPPMAGFLEIQHYGAGFASLVGSVVTLGPDTPPVPGNVPKAQP